MRRMGGIKFYVLLICYLHLSKGRQSWARPNDGIYDIERFYISPYRADYQAHTSPFTEPQESKMSEMFDPYNIMKAQMNKRSQIDDAEGTSEGYLAPRKDGSSILLQHKIDLPLNDFLKNDLQFLPGNDSSSENSLANRLRRAALKRGKDETYQLCGHNLMVGIKTVCRKFSDGSKKEPKIMDPHKTTTQNSRRTESSKAPHSTVDMECCKSPCSFRQLARYCDVTGETTTTAATTATPPPPPTPPVRRVESKTNDGDVLPLLWYAYCLISGGCKGREPSVPRRRISFDPNSKSSRGLAYAKGGAYEPPSRLVGATVSKYIDRNSQTETDLSSEDSSPIRSQKSFTRPFLSPGLERYSHSYPDSGDYVNIGNGINDYSV